MDEGAGFEPRQVVNRRRSGTSRLAATAAVLTLVAVVWAGISGHRGEASAPTAPAIAPAIALATEATKPAAVVAVRPSVRPSTVVGLAVQPLDAIDPRGVPRDDAVAVAGWYVATAITDCPPLAAIYRDGALPYVRGDADANAFCRRTGILYASAVGGTAGPWISRLGSVRATVAIGVVVPIPLETIDGGRREVVVVGHFATSSGPCDVKGDCAPELVIDHIAWTPAT